MRKAKFPWFNVWVVLVTSVVQLLLSITPFVPTTERFWHSASSEEFYGRLTAFIGIQLLLLTTAVTLILLKGMKDQQDSFVEMRSALPLTLVKTLNDARFYNDFRAAVVDAENCVRIAYLAPYPPSEVPDKTRKRYYDEMLELMKERSTVTFKRLIRASDKNSAWVTELLKELKGRANVEIALLTKDLPADNEMPLALSVQVVDSDKTWLVAIRSHENERVFRDIYIENPAVATGMTDYFDRIWKVSDKLLDRGRITEKGEAFLGSKKTHGAG
jgi:hypothetical protein